MVFNSKPLTTKAFIAVDARCVWNQFPFARFLYFVICMNMLMEITKVFPEFKALNKSKKQLKIIQGNIFDIFLKKSIFMLPKIVDNFHFYLEKIREKSLTKFSPSADENPKIYSPQHTKVCNRLHSRLVFCSLINIFKLYCSC